MPAKNRPRPRLEHSVDSGDVKAVGVHIGDGYYSATYTCRACGAEESLTLQKRQFDGKWSVWAQEHRHNA